jgi:hypothetical protein
MTRAELILKLLQTCHLNVAERRQLVPPGIHFSEILAVIRDVIERERRFTAGHLTLERLDAGTYCFHYLEFDPQLGDMANSCCGPSVSATGDYPSVDSAVEAFLVHMRATHDLDGIEILGFPNSNTLGRATPR